MPSVRFARDMGSEPSSAVELGKLHVLVAGSKLGPYEILAPIGAGGTGEVYRARMAKIVLL
jgi:hypothetical protein